MVRKIPIKCPKCDEIAGYQENFMYMVLKDDVKCPKCDTVVIPVNKVEY